MQRPERRNWSDDACGLVATALAPRRNGARSHTGFFVRFPLELPFPSRTGGEAAPVPRVVAPVRGRRLLVVDEADRSRRSPAPAEALGPAEADGQYCGGRGMGTERGS